MGYRSSPDTSLVSTMIENTLQRSEVVAAGVFVISTALMLLLAGHLITPAVATVTIGETTVQSGSPGPSIRTVDIAVLTVAAFASGASAVALFRVDRGASGSTMDSPDTRSPDADHDHAPTAGLLEARRQEWEETASRLASNERIVYEIMLDADGVLPQSEIVDRTEFSKATVSRTLDTLEAKNLIERKRRGVGNVIILS
ncbi:regulatory protein GntR HTH (plasmid) [Haloarcula hispanica ATCC 33960]|uniref:Regulatory protein GntR HTH n=1 Tax=Haloarcula hispanica (strain ATCC 33960 / DSM 4426 / JCM 8911 / NBRC 102182 / NCIMB 2187 / VKM B-1755) TaxID=634497 RepID=G0I0S1_HALHT|nr:regulatory protein GntR HTH [Haloarcula hispanica ATCC 33960]